MNIQSGTATKDMGAPASADGTPADAVNLMNLVKLVRIWQKLILITAAAVVVLAVAVVLPMKPKYSASASVILNQQKNNTVEDVNKVISDLPTDSSAVQNQIQMLTSESLADSVIAKLKLNQDPEFNPRPASWVRSSALSVPAMAPAMPAVAPTRPIAGCWPSSKRCCRWRRSACPAP